jgi:hypothetical protein
MLNATITDIQTLNFSRTFPAKFGGRCPLLGYSFYAGESIRKMESAGIYLPNETIALLGNIAGRTDCANVEAFDADKAAAHLATGGVVLILGSFGYLPRRWATKYGKKPATAATLARRGAKARVMALRPAGAVAGR